MFSLIYRLVRYASGMDCNDEGMKVDTDKNVVAAVARPSDVQYECSVMGTVTKLNDLECYGLVNDCIYFSFDVVNGREDVQIGNVVSIRATRPHLHHSWKATSVQVLSHDWDSGSVDPTRSWSQFPSLPADGKDVNTVEIIEGEVTECYALFGIVEGKYRFETRDCEVDFKPVTGDLVVVTVMNRKIVRWSPKSTFKVEGVITASEIDCGIINENIVFFFESCKCNIAVSHGEKVRASVVESRQRHFGLRAYELTPVEGASRKTICQKPRLTNQPGLRITSNLDFDLVEVSSEKELSVTLCNDEGVPLEFLGCSFRGESGCSPFLVSSGGESCVIRPCGSINAIVLCRPKTLGWHDDLLLFEFKDYVVSRNVTAFVIDAIQGVLNPTAPFSRAKSKRMIHSDMEDLVVIPGEKVFIPKANFAGFSPAYTIPRSLWKMVESDDIAKALPVLSAELHSNNYKQKFHCLLHLEEIQMHKHMWNYDMFEVVLSRMGEFLSLQVPGLAEGRPSLLIGDRAMLIPPHSTSNCMFEGYIHEVHKEGVFLKFHDNFQSSYGGETFNVTFRFSRTGIRRMHEGVNAVHRNLALLFPKRLIMKRPLVRVNDSPAVGQIEWQNPILNGHQKEAVCRILSACCRPLPYIVFGPPGTGKTVTLVEAVLQVFLNIGSSRILICTPSNSAADLITERLIQNVHINTKEVVRLNSYQRNVDIIPESIKPFCLDKNSIGKAAMFRIIVSTCTTAGAFCDFELPKNHFTHLFIDEAGQLTEPECMVPISFVSNCKNAHIVLAGDPEQLGPVLLSFIAKDYGLQVSFLERMMTNPLYRRDDRSRSFNSCLVTMLVHSYRSHPAILYYSSKTFYFSQVLSMAQDASASPLMDWELLPKKGFPVIFDGLRGEESREENSPSWFNSSEVVKACRYLGSLYQLGLSPEEVGIIAPYKKQVEKLRMLASALNLELCKIGSVEEFQGQERRAIIITTVRSCKDFVSSDVLHSLGFLASPKRFNVAVTRAKELLVVIGNPHILSQDDIWKGFINYCKFNGGYTGCEFTL